MVVGALVQFIVIPSAFGELAGIQIIAPQGSPLVRPGALLELKVDMPQGLPVPGDLSASRRGSSARRQSGAAAFARTTSRSPRRSGNGSARGGGGALSASRRFSYQGTTRMLLFFFDETSIHVTPEAALTALRAQSPLRFTKTIGEVRMLRRQGCLRGSCCPGPHILGHWHCISFERRIDRQSEL